MTRETDDAPAGRATLPRPAAPRDAAAGRSPQPRPTPEKPAAGRRPIGRIVSVNGASAVVHLDAGGRGAPRAQAPIGALVRIDFGDGGAAFAIVSSLEAPSPLSPDDPRELWLAEIELMGEAQAAPEGGLGRFRRGLSRYPALGAPVYKASRADLDRAYSLSKNESAIDIGRLHQDQRVPISARLNELLGKHFAVLGATGSGKSCSVALVLRAVLDQCPNGHLLVLDAHGEYAAAFGDRAHLISRDTLKLPYWMLTHEEISEVLMGPGDDYAAEIELLADLIRQAKAHFAASACRSEGSAERPGRAPRHRRVDDIAAYSADAPTPYRIADLLRLIDDRMGSLDHQAAVATHRRLRGRIDSRLRDNRFQFMFGPDAAERSLASVCGEMFRMPVAGKPLALIDLTGLPSEILSVLVSVTCRLAFDFGVRAQGRAPLTVICEEAHKYIPADAAAGFQPARRSIAKIAKEGRKYGVSLGIVTQRPSELDPTILSQCNTVLALRLSNELDQNIVRSAVSDAAQGLLRFLPSLSTGEAIIFGEGVALPLRVVLHRLPADRLPGCDGASFGEAWLRDVNDRSFVEQVSRLMTSAMVEGAAPAPAFEAPPAQTQSQTQAQAQAQAASPRAAPAQTPGPNRTRRQVDLFHPKG